MTPTQFTTGVGDDGIPATALPFFRQLEDLYDVQVGLPITSHRKPPLGSVLVLAKTIFRKSFQVFINEVMHKQQNFNEVLLQLVSVLYRDLHSVESATLALRAALQERIRKLEERVAVLEASQVGAESRAENKFGVATTASDKREKN